MMSAIVVTIGFLFQNLSAQEEGVKIHGAISQSFIYSKNNHYVFEGSKGGSIDFSETYINFSQQFGSTVRVGLQISSRNFGNQDDSSPKLDWAYGDYRATEKIGFRFGKVKLPFGIFNEARDVDFAKQNILLDQGIYPESFRLLINSYSGGSMYGAISLSQLSAGDIEYELFGGTTIIPDTYPTTQYFRKAFNSPTSSQNNILLTGSNIRYLPFDLLKTGYSFLYAEGYTSIASDNLNSIVPNNAANPVETAYAKQLLNIGVANIEKAISFQVFFNIISAEVQINDFTIVGEFETFRIISQNEQSFIQTITEGVWENLTEQNLPHSLKDSITHVIVDPLAEKSTIDKYAWFINLFYQANDDFGLYRGFGYCSQDANIADNTQNSQEQNTRTADQKDYSVGANYYINDYFLLKAEYHYIDGIYGVYNPEGSPIINDGNLWITRISYSF